MTMTRCLPMQSSIPTITPTPMGVPLRAVCGLVDPSARFQWGYGGAVGWSAADEQPLSSTFLHFRKSSTQPRWSTTNPVRKHLPSSCGLPPVLQTRFTRLLNLCSRPTALRKMCACINMPGQSIVLIFCNDAASNSTLPILLFFILWSIVIIKKKQWHFQFTKIWTSSRIHYTQVMGEVLLNHLQH